MSETYPDIPRPGDPTFTSFPKALPEDCVQYTIHALTHPLPSPTATRSRLLEIKRAAEALCKRLLGGYIWQREAFSLELVGPAWHLAGSTSFGDSVADEWLVVYLLREVSKGFEDVWVRVVDSDAEFLLIEAANVLPRWLNPEVADFRVWINKGQLRIIPREAGSGSMGAKEGRPPAARNLTARNLTLEDAMGYIRSSADAMIHSPLMEEEAFYRLRNYPAAIAESMHTTLLIIPRNLAFILHRTPTHISAAVEAFYLRDPISLQPLQGKKDAKLKFSPKDCVTTSVKFTRVGFAQLKSQEFTAPAAWATVADDTGSNGSKEKERRNMGMKLACGFEMLVGDPQNQDKRAVREIEMLLEDVELGEEVLPTDNEVKTWPQQEDDEGWLDVNYEDFERELSGKGRAGKDGATGSVPGAFGDKVAQENLRRMVERFEQFLNDDDAGAEGADFDDMDFDNDDDDDDRDDNHDDSSEDRDASFDEEELSTMMREMMGMPSNATEESGTTTDVSRIQEIDSDDDSDEEDLKKVMQRMEDELREAGALNLDATAAEDDATAKDPRYQLAKNLLESFKGQGGTAGPMGNLMGSLGYTLPRDEGKRKR